MEPLKFLRNYYLTIQSNLPPPVPEFIVIQPPFTIEFDITRTILNSANISSIRIYNLSVETRNKIQKNYFDWDVHRQVVLQAGYGAGPQLPVIFSGQITEAWSVREGNNFITQIESFDGGFAFSNAKFTGAFPESFTQRDVIVGLINSLGTSFVNPGAVGAYQGLTSRGKSYGGSTTEILRELTDGGFFIDNGKANALLDREYVQSPSVPVINSASGLLGTPVRERTMLRFDMIFEPLIHIGQLVNLQSVTEANYNGFAKVIRIHHKGMISPAVCGEALTSIDLLYGVKNLTAVRGIAV